MFEKMLAVTNESLTYLRAEKQILVGNIFYFTSYLKEVDNDPEIIEDALREIVEYLAQMAHCVDEEYKIFDAINRYLYSLCNDSCAFNGFELSDEYKLFQGIIPMLNQSRSMRISEYLWYIRNYRSYIDTNRIAKSYKIFAKKRTISDESYAKLYETIPHK
ncbi:MAG: hypothetical protein OSJ70_07515 [Bacilli bacterium]|nr:hypothetical protein [Bacilli bacterium]